MLTAHRIPVSHDEASPKQWDWPLQHNDGVVKVQENSDNWEVDLDMSFFEPKEIEVKVIGDCLNFHCQHEKRSDVHGGTVSREVNRSYRLPDDLDRNTIKSHLMQNGVLRVTAKKRH
ncbi:unnamed protein product [Meloidogyne enterolobii]|uniref:Uncharacterized protein n=2 Tax=Meloidogyne enterolobii TaxID=390850 RepID=A0ACB0Z4V3_MELEN